ncbi:LuxR C-terminal-related transcriptional regulator [Streptomyces sp. NPDC088752]|uniref:helix-turn-helix transcriptional regulator n=1 Tax=Streptomyces sp. NPDC088752 TaxID=3154963 RepID=UPI0034140436
MKQATSSEVFMHVIREWEWPFTGRKAEMALFGEALQDPGARAFSIHGPTGVGRTRMAEECRGVMERAGMRTSQIVGRSDLSMIPFGAAGHLLHRLAAFDGSLPAYTVAARLISELEGHTLHIVVDDVHLLDAPSAMLLRQLMDAGAVFLVLTVRSDAEVSDAVAALLRTDAVYRVDLKEFSHDAAENLLRGTLGGAMERRTMQELMDISHGNALFLRELVLGAIAEGRLTSDGEVWELNLGPKATPALIELVRARVEEGGLGGKRILDLLALCGPVPLTDAEAEGPSATIVTLEKARLVKTHLDGRRTVVELSHPLFGEVLQLDIAPEYRSEILLRQAQRTERFGMRRTADPLKVAQWRLEATGTADTDLLVRAASLAHASHEYSQVIALLSGIALADRTTLGRTLLGSALMEVGEFDEAETVLREAQERAESEDEALAALQVRTYSLFMDGQVDLALRVTREATAAMGSSRARELLVLNEATMLAVAGEPARANRLFDTLTDDVTQAAESGAWLRGRPMKAAALAVQGRTDAALRVVDDAYRIHLSLSDREGTPHQASELISAVLAYSDAGRFAEAADAGAQGVRELMDTDIWFLQLWLLFHMGRGEWLAGHPVTARRLYGEAAAQARRVNHGKVMRLALSGLAASAAVCGDLHAATAAVRESMTYPYVGYLSGEERLGEAWVNVVAGNHSEALRVLNEAVISARDTGHLTSEGMLLTDIARLGDARAVAGRLSEIARDSDGLLAPARAGLAAGLAESDSVALAECADAFEGLGADLLTAEAHIAAADAWQKAGRDREGTGATMRGRAALTRCEGARTPLVSLAAGAPTARLTPRERQIASLAVKGLSSKEIADRLMFSVRTIHNSLQAIYKKVGVTNRKQLAEHLGRYLTLAEGDQVRAEGELTAKHPVSRRFRPFPRYSR